MNRLDEMKKVKDYLNKDYELFEISGNGFTLHLTKELSKKGKAYFKDILETEVKGSIEVSKIRLAIHV